MRHDRRTWLASAAATLAAPALAQTARVLPAMTEGPFYPPRRWRQTFPGGGDWDADLTRNAGAPAARGEHLALLLQVADTRGRAIDDAEVEIWQCDALAAYRHPSVPLLPGQHDPGFQGFGAARSDRDGRLRLRTIRPVAYPGRTPHVHVTLRHPDFGELTSQLFVAGDPGNASDALWRRLDPDAQRALAMMLQPAEGDGLRWQVRHMLVVPS